MLNPILIGPGNDDFTGNVQFVAIKIDGPPCARGNQSGCIFEVKFKPLHARNVFRCMGQFMVFRILASRLVDFIGGGGGDS